MTRFIFVEWVCEMKSNLFYTFLKDKKYHVWNSHVHLCDHVTNFNYVINRISLERAEKQNSINSEVCHLKLKFSIKLLEAKNTVSALLKVCEYLTNLTMESNCYLFIWVSQKETMRDRNMKKKGEDWKSCITDCLCFFIFSSMYGCDHTNTQPCPLNRY